MTRFRWQLEGKLAGMSRPLIRGKETGHGLDDAAFLKGKGVTVIVSLEEIPADEAAAKKRGFKYYHFPIRDGSWPSLPAVRAIVETIAKLIDDGEKVAVHCTAGLGRTGTVLALYLVHTGLSAQDAIEAVRSREPMAIENKRQEEAIVEYESFLSKTGRRK